MDVNNNIITNGFPMSYGQERMWFMSELEKGKRSSYIIKFALCLEGSLDKELLKESIAVIVQRHEVLRSSFALSEGNPVQLIHPAIEFTVVERALLPGETETDALQELVRQEADQGFDLSQPPLFRINLFTVKPGRYLLVVRIHHIVFDGWSVEIFMNELSAVYNAKGQQHSLPALPIQYVDYTMWQKEKLGGENLARLVAYWKKQLKGCPEVLHLPVDFPRPAIRTSNGQTLKFELDSALSTAARTFSAARNISLYITLQTAFGALLSRWSGQKDIVIGVPLANRSQKQLAELVGLFVNTLPVRIDLSGNIGLDKLLDQVRGTMLDTLEHQDLPLDMIIKELNQGRSLSHSPLFQVMLVLQNVPSARLNGLQDVSISAVQVREETAKFDISLLITETPGGLTCEWEFNTDLFAPATITRLHQGFEIFLGKIAGGSSEAVQRIDLVAPQERDALIIRSPLYENGFTGKSLTQLFEESAARNPDRIALAFNGQELSYASLNEKANQLSSKLRALHVGPGSIAGVLLDPSPGMIIALLAIVKAGAAYLPLDPSFPPARLEYMIGDSGVKVLLCDAAKAGPEAPGVIKIDPRDPSLYTEPASNPGLAIPASALLYVIYTSGSTGTPKGIQLEHRNMVNLLNHQYHFTNINFSSVLQFASISFDVASQEIFSTLLAGGKLTLIEHSVKTDVARLFETIEKSAVKTVFFPASFIKFLFGSDEFTALLPAGIEHVVTAGEQIVINDRLRTWLSAGNIWLHNHYGPSETHVVTTQSIDPSKIIPGLPPIGTPVINSEAYILNEEGLLQPPGVPGELYVAGEQLGRGYLGRPELTAERFLKNTTGSGSYPVMYKTGDQVKLLPDGAMQYLGRLDSQVKIRGYRVEIAEIESALNSSGLAEEAAVIVKTAGNDARLAVYFVSKEGAVAGSLRNYLSERLPPFMVPDNYYRLDAMPLTPTGKTDRLALDNMEGIGGDALGETDLPQNETEEVLLSIWKDILNKSSLSVTANFFESGGHSMVATRVCFRIQTQLHRKIEIRDIFAYPTVRSLAGFISKETLAGYEPILPAPTQEFYGLSPIQEQVYVISQDQEASAAYVLPGKIKITGKLDIEAFKKAFSGIVNRYEILRTTFPLHGDFPKQLVHSQGDFSSLLVLTDTLITDRGTFVPDTFPLWRATLCSIAPGEHHFLFNIHHLVIDFWSMEIVLKELFSLYALYSAGQAPPATAAALQYKDYVAWMERQTEGAGKSGAGAFWLNRLSEEAGLTEIAPDFKRGLVKTYRGKCVTVGLGSLAQALRSSAQKKGVTPFVYFVACVKLLLYRYSRSKEITVGTPVSGRAHPDLASQVGLFVNTLPLRTTIDPSGSFDALLQSVNETFHSAHQHQSYPFREMVKQLFPGKNNSGRNPLFEIIVEYRNLDTLYQGFEAGGLQLQPGQVAQQASQVDISFLLLESGGDMRVDVGYNSDLYADARVEYIASHLKTLLKEVLAAESLPLGAYNYIGEEEKNRLVYAYNDTKRIYPQQSFAQLLAEHVRSKPQHYALKMGERNLTYTELDTLINRLANLITGEVALGRNDTVGIMLASSPEQIACVIAVLKSGAAFFPIDTVLPDDRVRFMLSDNAPKIIVTDKANRALIASTGFPFIVIDEGDQLQQMDTSFTAVIPDPLDLAYVMYTSGSTGKPKGLVINHASMMDYVYFTALSFSFTSEDKILQLSSCSFDTFIEEVFAILSAAGTLVLLKEKAHDMAKLINTIESEKITLLTTTPLVLNELNTEPARVASLRLIISAGEELKYNYIDRLIEQTAVYNLYGPTEATIASTWYKMEPGSRHISIGKPIPNRSIYIVDDDLNLLPGGFYGEILIGGDALCGYYINRPELSKEKFVPNPFVEGEIVYRTGDVGRWLADGNIEFAGRKDSQVKIRGNRIELGEIEQVLSLHEDLKEAAVAVEIDKGGDKQLVAYLVVHNTPDYSGIKAFLRKSLPVYMVPSRFILLEKMPLNSNGKIDRNKLALATGVVLESDVSFVPPVSQAELFLAQLWQNVLGIGSVSISENFFDLGGDSLKAIRFLKQLNNEYPNAVSVSDFYDTATIEALGRLIESRFATQESSLENFESFEV